MEILRLGDVEIAAILDVEAFFPLSDVFSDSAPPGDIATLGERYPEDFTADGWRFRCRCFLVRTPAATILVDAGIGPEDSFDGRELGMGGRLPDELATLGVAPADIDHVVITHIHTDHTGWCTERSGGGWNPRFPNARYHLHPADLALARVVEDEDDARYLAEVFEPLERTGQLVSVPEDHEISRGVTLLHAPGHTPGHRCALVDAGEERVLVAGDLLHFTLQVSDTDFLSPHDRDPAEGCATRAVLLDQVEREGMILATAHVPGTGFARLRSTDGGRSLDHQ